MPKNAKKFIKNKWEMSNKINKWLQMQMTNGKCQSKPKNWKKKKKLHLKSE